MTYEEAFTAVVSLLPCDLKDCAACGRQAKEILDAIGYREMLSAGNLLAKDASQLLGAYQAAVHERDEARALVEKFADAFREIQNAHRDEDMSLRDFAFTVATVVGDAAGLYHERSWK